MAESSNAKILFAELDRARDDLAIINSLERIDSNALVFRAEKRAGRARDIEIEIVEMVSSLPNDRWAAAINGRFVQGLSVKAVAGDMSVSTSTVYSYLSQAIKWLDDNFDFGKYESREP